MTKRDPFNTAEIATEREEREFERQKVIDRTKHLLRSLMQTTEGRELVYFLLDLSQVNTSSFNTNALAMAFNEGRRSFGIDLQRLLDPELYQSMLKESYERTRKQRHGGGKQK